MRGARPPGSTPIRKITSLQVLAFLALFSCAAGAAFGTAWLFDGVTRLGDFRGVVLVGVGAVALYAWAVVVFRCFLRLFPLHEGEIPQGSQQEFVYHVYVLFFLVLFYSIMRSGFVPAPLMRVFYLALGAKLGPNTYSQGIIHDPPFVEIGANSVVGQSALIVPHVIEGSRLAHYPIRIGDNVTIGASAVVLSGVTVGDGAIVSTGAVVPKGTVIGPGEVWGGVPARRIRGAERSGPEAREPDGAGARG